MGICISRFGSLNYRPNYISACSENHARFLASPSCPCHSVPPSYFSPKRTVSTLESVEGKKPGSIRTSPALLAFSLSARIPLFPAGREAVNDRIVCCRKENSHVQPSQSLPPNLWDSADFLELLLPHLQGWAFPDVAPYGGGIAQEKVKWLRLLCCQTRWAKRLKTLPQFSSYALSARPLHQLQLVSSESERTVRAANRTGMTLGGQGQKSTHCRWDTSFPVHLRLEHTECSLPWAAMPLLLLILTVSLGLPSQAPRLLTYSQFPESLCSLNPHYIPPPPRICPLSLKSYSHFKSNINPMVYKDQELLNYLWLNPFISKLSSSALFHLSKSQSSPLILCARSQTKTLYWLSSFPGRRYNHQSLDRTGLYTQRFTIPRSACCLGRGQESS